MGFQDFKRRGQFQFAREPGGANQDRRPRGRWPLENGLPGLRRPAGGSGLRLHDDPSL